jgi:hypothetical protein
MLFINLVASAFCPPQALALAPDTRHLALLRDFTPTLPSS